MTFYEEMQATAAGLIAEFGMPMRLIRQTGGIEDPVEGERVGATETSSLTQGVMLSSMIQWVRESLAEGADKLCVIDSSYAPALGDSLEANAGLYTVVRIDEIRPAELPLAYTLHLRA